MVESAENVYCDRCAVSPRDRYEPAGDTVDGVETDAVGNHGRGRERTATDDAPDHEFERS